MLPCCVFTVVAALFKWNGIYLIDPHIQSLLLDKSNSRSSQAKMRVEKKNNNNIKNTLNALLFSVCYVIYCIIGKLIVWRPVRPSV